jgi:hypothetical protein
MHGACVAVIGPSFMTHGATLVCACMRLHLQTRASKLTVASLYAPHHLTHPAFLVLRYERRRREPVSCHWKLEVPALTEWNSWRRSGQANRQSQDGRSGNNTPTREAGRQQAMNALSGNAWGGPKGKAPGGGNERGPVQPASYQGEHIPVRDFNADEVRAYLRKRMSISFIQHEQRV